MPKLNDTDPCPPPSSCDGRGMAEELSALDRHLLGIGRREMNSGFDIDLASLDDE